MFTMALAFRPGLIFGKHLSGVVKLFGLFLFVSINNVIV